MNRIPKPRASLLRSSTSHQSSPNPLSIPPFTSILTRILLPFDSVSIVNIEKIAFLIGLHLSCISQQASFHTSCTQQVSHLNKRVRWTIDLRDKPYLKQQPSNRLSGRATQVHSKPFDKPSRFAVVHVSGRQYRVCEGDKIVCDRMFVDIGEKIHLNKVLMVAGEDYTLIGRPIVEPRIVVQAVVEEQTRTQPLVIFKRKKRKRYQRWNTSRNLVTVLRIEKIHFEEPEVEQKLSSSAHQDSTTATQSTSQKTKQAAESL